MNRRHLLKGLIALPALAYASQLLALPNQQKKCLFVFLRGGYDAANLLIPYKSTFYYEARPSIAIKSANSVDGLHLDSSWALHPALKNSVFPLFQKNQAAFIPFAGTDDMSRSHFETQDSIEMGQHVASARDFQSGFLNRLAVELSNGKPIAFTDKTPLIMRGELDIPNVRLQNLKNAGISAEQVKKINAMYANTSLAGTVKQGFDVKEQAMQDLQMEMDKASRDAISTKGFEAEAARVARLMREDYSLGFIDVGGWDTHVGQGAETGNLANKLEELGRGLASFAAGMQDVWKDTLVIVVSEFGRTFRENGNKGTDHGHGSVYWVLGGAINGGKVYGEQVPVDAKHLNQNRDFPVLNNYRDILGGMFARHFNLSNEQVMRVFPEATIKDLGIV